MLEWDFGNQFPMNTLHPKCNADMHGFLESTEINIELKLRLN